MPKADQITLLQFRRDMNRYARPSFFSRCCWWLAGWFGMQTISEVFLDPTLHAECKKMVGIIDAMTHEERSSPEFIDRSRRQRIAKGAGVLPRDVTQLIQMYEAGNDWLRKLECGDLPTERWPF